MYNNMDDIVAPLAGIVLHDLPGGNPMAFCERTKP
jgi:hypothetical protein